MGYLAGSGNTGAAEATDSTSSALSSTATTHSSALFFTSPPSCTYKFNSHRNDGGRRYRSTWRSEQTLNPKP